MWPVVSLISTFSVLNYLLVLTC